MNESFRTRPRAGLDMLRQIRHMARTTAGRGEEGRAGQDKVEKAGFKRERERERENTMYIHV